MLGVPAQKILYFFLGVPAQKILYFFLGVPGPRKNLCILKNMAKTCITCNRSLSKTEYTKNRNVCKRCTSFQRNVARNHTPESYITIVYNKLKSARVDMEWDIDLDHIKTLWQKQDGRCALSGVFMTWHGGEGRQDLNASICLLYTSPSPRDRTRSRMPSSA